MVMVPDLAYLGIPRRWPMWSQARLQFGQWWDVHQGCRVIIDPWPRSEAWWLTNVDNDLAHFLTRRHHNGMISDPKLVSFLIASKVFAASLFGCVQHSFGVHSATINYHQLPTIWWVSASTICRFLTSDFWFSDQLLVIVGMFCCFMFHGLLVQPCHNHPEPISSWPSPAGSGPWPLRAPWKLAHGTPRRPWMTLSCRGRLGGIIMGKFDSSGWA